MVALEPTGAPRDRSVPRSRVNSGDRSIDRRGRITAAPPILSYGFRPFFLLGSLYAALAVPIWLWSHLGGGGPVGPIAGLAWHAHEMLFGCRVAAPFLDTFFVPALIAGGVAWSGAFALFVLCYGPMLFTRRLAA